MAKNKEITSLEKLSPEDLALCARYNNVEDIFAMSRINRSFHMIIDPDRDSDRFWDTIFRARWPNFNLEPNIGAAAQFLRRHKSIMEYRFQDTMTWNVQTDSRIDNLLISNQSISYPQDHRILTWDINNGENHVTTVEAHKSTITTLRSFPLQYTSFFKDEICRHYEDVFLSASLDHTIKLWYKGVCKKIFRGHNGPVTILSDTPLGDEPTKLFASGGQDTKVCLWSTCKKNALKSTLHGHQKPIISMSIDKHNTSHMITMSKDTKIKVWDINKATSHQCVNPCLKNFSMRGNEPIGIRYMDQIIYTGSDSTIEAIDTRTMTTAFKITSREKLYSFEVLPSKSNLCVGKHGSAVVYDIRMANELRPVFHLNRHHGAVTIIHIDPFKIITGGPQDRSVYIWDPTTGRRRNSLLCSERRDGGCYALATSGYRIVTAGSNRDGNVVTLTDFSEGHQVPQ